jgi:outer membrane protein OmpA-like peptidoglycan-associated protein
VNFGLAALLVSGSLGLAGCSADGGSPFGIFATEDWVRNQMKEQNAQIDARMAKLDARLSQVAAQTGEARKVADEGVRKADAANSRLTEDMANRNNRTMVEAKTLQFATGKFSLQPAQKQTLDEVYAVLSKNPTYTADIVGQADRQGKKADNSLLSWRRTEHVRRYLTEKGNVLHRVSFIGMGEDLAEMPARQTESQADFRQVTITVYKPAMN